MPSKWQPICLIHLAVSVCYEEVECSRRTQGKSLGAGMRTNNKLNPHVTPGP